MRVPKTDDLIETELKERNKKLAEHFKSDAIIIKSPIKFGLDDVIRFEIENLHKSPIDRPKVLVVLLETNGGYIEVVERIYRVMRNHYGIVNFIVPNYAYSAGTVLVLSGDDIFMDYYSVLGPIDPQMENENNRFVSGLGYLAKYEELLGRINGAPDPDAVRGELAYLIKKFDPAELFDLEQSQKHAEELLVDWLSRHKFKDWNETETAKKPVTDQDRKDRAEQIAKVLGNPDHWHSHGRGIGMQDLRDDDIKLKIKDFGGDAALNQLVRNYYELFIDFCKQKRANTPEHTVLHTRNGVRRV